MIIYSARRAGQKSCLNASRSGDASERKALWGDTMPSSEPKSAFRASRTRTARASRASLPSSRRPSSRADPSRPTARLLAPPDSRFTQQDLPAWRPTLTPGRVRARADFPLPRADARPLFRPPRPARGTRRDAPLRCPAVLPRPRVFPSVPASSRTLTPSFPPLLARHPPGCLHTLRGGRRVHPSRRRVYDGEQARGGGVSPLRQRPRVRGAAPLRHLRGTRDDASDGWSRRAVLRERHGPADDESARVRVLRA